MTDATPYGWSATTSGGTVSFFTGAQPDTSKFASVTPFTTESDFNAAIAAARNPPVTLASAQASQIAQLRAACTAAITGGFTSSALGSPHGYPSDDTSQMNLTASVTSSLLPGLPSTWTTPFWAADASGAWAFTPHSASQIQQVGIDGKAMIVAAQQKLAALTAEVQAAATAAAVQAVLWT